MVVPRCSVVAQLQIWQEVGPQEDLCAHTGSSRRSGSGIHCQDYPARVAGGILEGGRVHSRGLWELEFHGDPDMKQLSALGCLATEQVFAWASHMELVGTQPGWGLWEDLSCHCPSWPIRVVGTPVAQWRCEKLVQHVKE